MQTVPATLSYLPSVSPRPFAGPFFLTCSIGGETVSLWPQTKPPRGRCRIDAQVLCVVKAQPEAFLVPVRSNYDAAPNHPSQELLERMRRIAGGTGEWQQRRWPSTASSQCPSDPWSAPRAVRKSCNARFSIFGEGGVSGQGRRRVLGVGSVGVLPSIKFPEASWGVLRTALFDNR